MKPRIYRGQASYPFHSSATVWRCYDYMCNGQGRTPRIAYDDWQKQRLAMFNSMGNAYPADAYTLQNNNLTPQQHQRSWIERLLGC